MWILIVIVVAFIAFCIYSVFGKSYSESDELAYKQMREGFVKEFGEPTIELNTWGEDVYAGLIFAPLQSQDPMNTAIFVFHDKNRIVMNQKVYKYSDILDFRVNNQMSYKSSVSNSSTIGRAIVGGALAGGVGAIIGGSTAKRNTEREVDKVKFAVTTKDMSRPVVRITFEWEEGADTFYSILKNIMDMNLQEGV